MVKEDSIYSLIKQEFIDQVPGLFLVMDLKSRFIAANKTALKWSGFKSYDTMESQTYYNMPCKVAEQHENFVNQDEVTRERNNPVRILGYYCYANNDWKILFGEKYPIKNKNNEIIAAVSHFNDITNYNLIDLSKILNITTDKSLIKIHRKQVGYILENTYPNLPLSQRQCECMFFLLRGKTSKEIAKILNLSFRTIEGYIAQIKYKLNCSTKSEIIEKAITDGYINIIPNTLLEELRK